MEIMEIMEIMGCIKDERKRSGKGAENIQNVIFFDEMLFFCQYIWWKIKKVVTLCPITKSKTSETLLHSAFR